MIDLICQGENRGKIYLIGEEHMNEEHNLKSNKDVGVIYFDDFKVTKKSKLKLKRKGVETGLIEEYRPKDIDKIQNIIESL